MPAINPQTLAALQQRRDCIRNICILAHVDHGKTTLSDSLLATNGIISQKLAGKVRYLDSREDEQERGITMKSSAIALYFKVISNVIASTTVYPTAPSQLNTVATQQQQQQIVESEYLINLIDSPGHVDFSSEVSVASRLCDGALVLVDVVEGVCTQTGVVLRQAWLDKVKPVLVLNKIDRLISELKLTPGEAYVHLNKLIDEVNGILANLNMEEFVTEQDRLYTEKSEEWMKELDLEKESLLYFHPLSGNVLFASAVDGWAFRVTDFARIYADKLGMKESVLRLSLWGDFYLDQKLKRIIGNKHLAGRLLKPLAVQFILENIWSVYRAAWLEPDPDKVQKIMQSLQLRVSPYDLKSKDGRILVHSLMSQWLPLARATLLTVVDKLPSPIEAQPVKVPPILLPKSRSVYSEATLSLEPPMVACDASGAAVAFVAKMISVPRSLISGLRMDSGVVDVDGDSEAEVLVGVARIFSGTIYSNQQLHVLGPRYDPGNPHEYRTTVNVSQLFMLMGRELTAVDNVPAGNIVAIAGIAKSVLKWGTISSSLDCPSLGVHRMQTGTPILRVAIESADPSEMPQLIAGLQLLNQADPCAEVIVQETGEHVLLTAGELHLERCLKDLREIYAKVKLHVSSPIIPFRETISTVRRQRQPGEDDENDVSQSASAVVTNQVCSIQVSCSALPAEFTKHLAAVSSAVEPILDGSNAELESALTIFKQFQDAAAKDSALFDPQKLEYLWSLGPKRSGPNLLLNGIEGYSRPRWILQSLSDNQTDGSNHPVAPFEKGIIAGYNFATASGPLCGEPMMGVCFTVEDFQLIAGATSDIPTSTLSEAARMGQIITAMKDACRQAFMKWSPRLMLAMYSCEIYASAEVLGKVYGVISKRKGRILSEEMKESRLFLIKSVLPVAESFGFADEIRKKTSGAAQPQLIFEGFEVLDEDPYWVPTTQEELEDLGTKADRENIAKRYMDAVRKRKGMFVEEKMIQHAEKQRTLKIK